MFDPVQAWSALHGAALLDAVLARHDVKTAVTTSFGAESAVLLDMVARIDPATPVVFVDTGRLFAETHTYRERLVQHLGLSDVRVVAPSAAMVVNTDPDGTLYETDPDACCQARKVMPYAQAMAEFDAVVTGRKRYHGGARRDLPSVERAGPHIKINPLAHATARDLESAFAARGLPRHPLAERGYASIGCEPCTARTCPRKGGRTGRWPGRDKSECGIHLNFDPSLQALGT